MNESYDLLVIGSGPGGYVAAIKAAKLGKKTAIIEKGEIGGTCLNRGCIPTKTLIHSSHFLSMAKSMKEAGITFTGLDIDYERLKERKEEVVLKIRKGVLGLLKANGVKIYQGEAKIIQRHLVRVKCGEDEENLQADNILIATGSQPVRPNIEGVNLKNVVTSDELLSGNSKLYKKLLIIGGGVIGVEMASIYKELGSEVEIIEAMDRILYGMDKEISQSIAMGLKKKKVSIHTGSKVVKISEGGSYGLVCEYIEKEQKKTCEAEGILLSVGRGPNIEGLFEDIDIEMDGPYIKVNENFETSLPNIYAVGDVIRGKQLAHLASAQGIVAVERICGLEPSIDLKVIPSCIYTVPEVATVGMDEGEAKARGFKVETGKYPMLGNSKTLLSMGERGFIKLVCDADSKRLLGAQLLCDRATDIIGELALAISNKLTYKDIASIIRPHPTYEEAITEAAHDIDGMAIHLIPKK
ncbi:dihydrolipoyl dehydrogenase [Herbinix luporum]|jgi:dihydrolipoamide dehydrogenase|uniref:Dihydrolipoyl dehydrogenase n=1 Tax=Herbinix luporum TaxID=1679721 RepID=A0A0K8J742_9FIRM|nr:dihydrolipoyl dehydrogenase [Herbinix luporum]MDI9488037.1 dihydrolipoyl dehydrogenase [Bacillota bacterium]CUH93355.1 hypothetical protein SD1D_1811 [Herbinix luporum]HHT56210.1 dihydrolipoyl dehydrogenase [Herbinix luporum]